MVGSISDKHQNAEDKLSILWQIVENYSKGNSRTAEIWKLYDSCLYRIGKSYQIKKTPKHTKMQKITIHFHTQTKHNT